MEPFKPRTKILLIVGASKITFSGNKRDAQIATLANGAEVRAKAINSIPIQSRRIQTYRNKFRRYQSTKLQINTSI
jgi:hypothetical protein